MSWLSFLLKHFLNLSCYVSSITEETATVGRIWEIVTIASRNILILYVHLPIAAYPTSAPALFLHGNLSPCFIPLRTFKYPLHVERFELTADITYQQYVYAVRSDGVLIQNLLPPEYPSIRLWFRYQRNFEHKLHRDCPGLGSWHGELECDYELPMKGFQISLIKKISFGVIIASGSLLP